MSHKDVTLKTIYGLYDKDENLVFTGTIDDIAEFTSANKATIQSVITKKVRLQHKYFVVRIGYEEITEKKCNKCGRVLPLKYMAHRHRPSDGKWVPRSICNMCKAEESEKYRIKQKKIKKKGGKL